MSDNNLSRIFRLISGFAILMLLSASIASATPHPGQSVNVVFIGSPVIASGGTLPTAGGDFNAFTFTNMAPVNVNAGTLSSYDTVVLNMASSAMGCNANKFTASQKSDINAFVAGGGKLIIYDSECTFGGSVDYSWLTFPFKTDNPGAFGARGGTLTIVEDNILSSNNSADSHFISAANITRDTDAVGDMNVVNLTTVDPNWCLDMTGMNVQQKFGAVHMYAKRGTTGLMVYNGMDTDVMRNNVGPLGGGQLAKIWLQELQSTSTLLPCGQAVVGITLTPQTATNTIGSTHTVTATLKDLFGVPQPGELVTFKVDSGPNAGKTGTNTTDANGQATFTYTGSGSAGTDSITASFVNANGLTVTSSAVTKEWVTPTAAGITLTPTTATNPNGTTHTVTATIKNSSDTPQSGIEVTFNAVSGPNAGVTGSGTTDTNGEATFTYTGSGGAGTDSITASFKDSDGETVTSNTVTKVWTTGTSVPEFSGPGVMIPVAGIFGLILVLLRRKE
jgi:hypothetical protein